MRLRALLITSLLALPTTALASIGTVAQQITAATGGVVQTCPPEYVNSVCVRADGSVVGTAGVIDRTLPALIPGLWKDGPEQGISADIPQEGLTLHLIPRGEEQTLTVLQPAGTASLPSTGTVADQDSPGSVTIENPENAYFVVLDESNQPVRDLRAVRNGTYTVITSRYGRLSQLQQVKVSAEGLRTLTLPRLVPATASAFMAGGGLELPEAPGYLFLVYLEDGTLVYNLSVLQPGTYKVLSYRDGETGPVASNQIVQVGQVIRPQFNATFTGSRGSTPTQTATPPAATVPAPAPTPTPSSASPAPASSSSGQCWVNGYRRSNGTYVSGYYRRC